MVDGDESHNAYNAGVEGDNNNSTGVHYDSARLVRILTMFEPIEPIDEDLDRVLIPTEAQSAQDPDLN